MFWVGFMDLLRFAICLRGSELLMLFGWFGCCGFGFVD